MHNHDSYAYNIIEYFLKSPQKSCIVGNGNVARLPILTMLARGRVSGNQTKNVFLPMLISPCWVYYTNKSISKEAFSINPGEQENGVSSKLWAPCPVAYTLYYQNWIWTMNRLAPYYAREKQIKPNWHFSFIARVAWPSWVLNWSVKQLRQRTD